MAACSMGWARAATEVDIMWTLLLLAAKADGHWLLCDSAGLHCTELRCPCKLNIRLLQNVSHISWPCICRASSQTSCLASGSCQARARDNSLPLLNSGTA